MKNQFSRKNPWALALPFLTTLCWFFTLAAGTKQATANTLWNLNATPLNLVTTAEPPNVFITLDDSCSMWAEFNVSHGRHFDAAGDPIYSVLSDTGTYTHHKSFFDIAMNGVDEDDRFERFLQYPTGFYNESQYSRFIPMLNTHFHVVQKNEWDGIDWRRLSPNAFELYYNPSITYEPWPGYPPANFNRAYYYAHQALESQSEHVNLADHGGFRFYIHRETRRRTEAMIRDIGLPEGDSQLWTATGRVPPSSFDESNPIRVKLQGGIDLWDDYIKYQVSNNSFTKQEVSFNVPDAINCNDESHTNNPPYSDCLGAQARPIEIKDDGTGFFERDLADEKQNIANWFQYHRNRMTLAKIGLIEIIKSRPDLNWGGRLMVNNGQQLTVNWFDDGTWDGGNKKIFIPIGANNDSTAQSNQVLDQLLATTLPRLCLTPTRQAMQFVGEYFKNGIIDYDVLDDSGQWGTGQTTTPIASACQQNFHLILTDGEWTSGAIFPDPPDVDSSGNLVPIGDLNSDGYADTLADVAKFYYENDLRDDLTNSVPTNAFNDNNQQHLSQYIVGIGFNQIFDNLDANGFPSGVETFTSLDWLHPIQEEQDPHPATHGQAKLRDTWRAAYDSRGAIVIDDNASRAINRAMESIEAQSASVSGTSSIGAHTRDQIVSLRFDANGPNKFESELLTQTVDPSTGTLSAPTQQSLTVQPHGSRVIYSSKRSNSGNYTGIQFRDSALLNAQKATMTPADLPTAELTDYPKDLINYVRGDQSEEDGRSAATRNWRARTSIAGVSGKVAIGASGNSNLAYVGPPPNRYNDLAWAGEPEEGSPYSAHHSLHENRKTMIYFGANDGMLHGVSLGSTDTGLERMAYVPNAILGNLHKLTEPDYFLTNAFVDGLITHREYFTGSNWATLLVSGLRSGGQGYFALDVTDPTQFTSSNAGTVVKWEFTDEDDPDLGYTAGRPVIARLNNTKWGVIFGNGYNNTKQDGAASTSGNAMIYILNADTGTLIKKFDTGVGAAEDPSGQSLPNGIIEVSVVNTDLGGAAGTRNFTSDFIYAGDLFGNIWKIDISHDDPNNWSIALGRKPLMTVPGKSITSAPAVQAFEPGNASKGWLVYVGTGRYITRGDINDNTPNHFLAVLDHNDDSEIVLDNLVKQTTDTTKTATVDDFGLRFTSNNPVEYFDDSGQAVNKGWYFELDASHGERVISRPLIDADAVVFSTLIPTSTECSADTSSYLMALDPKTGGPPSDTFFDLNTNNTLDQNDTNPGALGAPSGIKHTGHAGYQQIATGYLDTGTQILASGLEGTVTGTRKFTGPKNEGQQSLIQLR